MGGGVHREYSTEYGNAADGLYHVVRSFTAGHHPTAGLSANVTTVQYSMYDAN